MINRAVWITQRRLLLAALVCALLLVAGYFVFVSNSWGHQMDDDAYFGREALSRRVIGLDAALLDRVSRAGLLLAGIALLAVAAVRRCTIVGVIAVIGLGCAVAGAEVLKHSLPWRALVSEDRLLESRFRMDTYPSGHATIGTSLALSFLLVSSSRWRPWLAVAAGCLSAGFCHRRPFCWLASAFGRIRRAGLVRALYERRRRRLLSDLAGGQDLSLRIRAAPCLPV